MPAHQKRPRPPTFDKSGGPGGNGDYSDANTITHAIAGGGAGQSAAGRPGGAAGGVTVPDGVTSGPVPRRAGVPGVSPGLPRGGA